MENSNELTQFSFGYNVAWSLASRPSITIALVSIIMNYCLCVYAHADNMLQLGFVFPRLIMPLSPWHQNENGSLMKHPQKHIMAIS
jgi:hypothetical protein